jgi:hypothetical protein
MKRWTAHPLLWTLPLLALVAPPARAGSVATFYGSIVITSLGNEGFTVKSVDPPADSPAPSPGSPTLSAGGTPAFGTGGGSATVAGSLEPAKPMPLATPSGGASGGGFSTPATAATGNPTPTATETTAGGTHTTVPVIINEEAPPPPIIVATPPPDTISTPVIVPAPPPGTGTDQPTATGGPGPTTTQQTPEPASLTLLALGGLGGWVYTRRRARA